MFIPFVVPFSSCLDKQMCWEKLLRGHTRANAGGLDLNRCYGDANPGDHEGTTVERLCGWVS